MEIDDKYDDEDPTADYNNENGLFIWNFIDPLKDDRPTNQVDNDSNQEKPIELQQLFKEIIPNLSKKDQI